MAPTPIPHPGALQSISRSLTNLITRQTGSSTPLASIFAVIVGQRLSPRSSVPTEAHTLFSRSSLASPNIHSLAEISSLNKRQTYILAIPTTYSSLNDSPAPGAVAGITLGAIGGFVLVLYIVLSLLRLYSGRTFIEERIVERRSHHRSHSRSRSRARSRSMSEVPRVRRERETTIIEERIERSRSRGPAEVVVEEEEDDVVEVFEEHSPERRGTGRSKRTSGFRTVDPAEPGGGSRPVRKISRR